jgi:branched-chain amino acid transport system substrate-binding protein
MESRTNRFNRGSAILAIFAFMAFVGCSSTKDSKKLGVLLSLTGPGAQYGRMVLDGIDLAVAELNARPGAVKWTSVVEDDATDPRVGFNAAQKLLEVDRVQGLVGPIASSVALTVAPLAGKQKILLLSPAASTPLLSGINPFVFRIYPSDTYDGAFLAKAARNRLQLSNVAILYINNDFGAGLQKTFTKTFESLGGRITGRETFNQGAASFRTQLTILSKPPPDGVFLIATVNDYIVALRQMRELGLRARVLAPITFDDPEIPAQVGSAAEGVMYSRPAFDPKSGEAGVANFVQSYRKKFGKEPSILNALGYDSANIMVKTLESHPGGGDAAQAALRAMVYDGATGRIIFDANGDVLKDLQLLEIRSGKAVPVGN